MISKNVVILTTEELEEIKRKAFLRGVERGKFEAHSTARGSEGHSGATESTGSASPDAAVRPANSSPEREYEPQMNPADDAEFGMKP